ncbi:MAG: hypothetical protein KF819_25150 [Labilithrix sp.]|nr:hypothetical protein [Labilithrix sp.]
MTRRAAQPSVAGRRRGVGLFGALTLALASACGPKSPPPPPGPPPVALQLDHACELAPAAGLEWIVDARPREIAETPDLIPAIALVVPEARFAAFAATHGGLDVRQMKELCVARYKDSSLTIARGPLDPARVETAFADRMTNPGGRTLVVPNPPVVRQWGEVNGEPQALTIFAREAVALEAGRGAAGSAPRVRAAEAFALGRLKRASPALKATLARAAELLGEAPARAFAPGPFEGELAQGLGGLLRASTAVGGSARFAGPPAQIAVRIVLTGAWGKDAQAAADRFIAAANVVADSPFGRLLSLNHPVLAPAVRGTPDALILDVTLDGMALARGLHDALDAEVGEIMRR